MLRDLHFMQSRMSFWYFHLCSRLLFHHVRTLLTYTHRHFLDMRAYVHALRVESLTDNTRCKSAWLAKCKSSAYRSAWPCLRVRARKKQIFCHRTHSRQEIGTQNDCSVLMLLHLHRRCCCYLPQAGASARLSRSAGTRSWA